MAIDAACFHQLHTVPAVQQEFAAHRLCHCSLCFLHFLNTHLLFLFFILRWCNFSPRVFYFVVDSSNSWQCGWKSYFEYQRYEIINWRALSLDPIDLTGSLKIAVDVINAFNFEIRSFRFVCSCLNHML